MNPGGILISVNDPLSQALVEQFFGFTVLSHHQEMPFHWPEILPDLLSGQMPRVVINAINTLDIDESEQRREEAYLLYALSIKPLVQWCAGNGVLYVHISTSCVFSGEGNRPLAEDDLPHPVSAYGDAKLLGEEYIRRITEDHLIVRVPDVYGRGRGPLDLPFIKKESEDSLVVAGGSIVAPACAADCAAAIHTLIARGGRGICHVGPEGQVSPREFVEWNIPMANRANNGANGYQLREVDPREFNCPGDRPLFNVLDISRFITLSGASPRSCHDALEAYWTDGSQ